MPPKVVKTDAQWREQLSEEQFRITRQHGTERAFTGAYWDEKRPGTYRCTCCDAVLFESGTKYDSGSGWPSFYEPATHAAVRIELDTTHGMRREEVLCANCDAHLGHRFPDGPRPTGVRYCINSASLDLQVTEEEADAPEEG